jgi:hypothetical protein
MSDDGFFTFLSRLGEDIHDRRAREAIQGLEERVAHQQRLQDGDVASLQSQVHTLTREVAAMKVALEVLSHVLVDSGAVDAATLDRKIAEARGSAEAARKLASSALCSNCGLSFQGAQLIDTGVGLLCKRCRAVSG